MTPMPLALAITHQLTPNIATIRPLTLEILWQTALEFWPQAYAPYSGFPVAALLVDEAWRVHGGVNVENIAYPQGQCAEAGAIAAMVLSGGRRIRHILVLGGKVGDGTLCTPCGGCRQKLREFTDAQSLLHIAGPEGVRASWVFDALLPAAFGPHLLPVKSLHDDRPSSS
jgi:cytidine deaminase